MAPAPKVFPNLTVTLADGKLGPVITTRFPPAIDPVFGETVNGGTGGGGVGGAEEIVNASAFEVTPPGLRTPTLATPGVFGRTKLAKSEFEFRKLVPTAAPLNNTVAPLTNLDPFTVSDTVVPAFPDDGDRLVTTGVGASTVNVAGLETPPPGLELDT